MFTVTGVPFAAIVPEALAGTVYSVSVKLPVRLLSGFTRIVYVPVVGNVVASIKPLAPKRFVARVVESGFSIDSVTQQIVKLSVRFKLTTWPAVPLKVSRPFCPGVVIFTVTGLAFAVMRL